ncbi:acyl carrier protein 1, chloroplastic-like [Macadamia integrifolia]|uniref:acyl carrier protein 1, chloroplastic-like n=1 Tax=Macadamia integrifolia TaxID=60698 RepID=UPI001C4EB8B1|nr:acyl carrier protein 1, chloroplastic-like [Macadamia integrifolia]
MATVSTASIRFVNSLKQSISSDRVTLRNSSVKVLSVVWSRNGFPSLRSSRFSVCCSAKPETIQKVCDIVKKQLALPQGSEVTPDSKFSALGADSLDTVEIVMGLEDEFGISVEEENSQNITTIQEAADLIEKLVQKKA